VPLLDHFNPPLYPLHKWESFHSRWANAIADALDRELPSRFFAEVQTHLGAQVEADVAEFEKADNPEGEQSTNGTTGVVAVRAYSPPAATMILPAFFPDDFEVQVRDATQDARLVAVIELVSPRNKDRPAARRLFAAKCASYLQRGVGVIAVDIVTTRQANMHDELVRVMELDRKFMMAPEALLAALAYRPARREDVNEIDVWNVALTVGGTLPVLPLALLGHGAIPLDLEATYTEARQRARL
jgi:hypothetical protein